MTDSKRFDLRVIPEAGLDGKCSGRIRIRETATSFSMMPHVEKVIPLAELKAQLHRLGFEQEQVNCTLAGFAHERSVTYEVALAPDVVRTEGFTAGARAEPEQ